MNGSFSPCKERPFRSTSYKKIKKERKKMQKTVFSLSTWISKEPCLYCRKNPIGTSWIASNLLDLIPSLRLQAKWTLSAWYLAPQGVQKHFLGKFVTIFSTFGHGFCVSCACYTCFKRVSIIEIYDNVLPCTCSRYREQIFAKPGRQGKKIAGKCSVRVSSWERSPCHIF